ncbi:MAG: sulfatase-like hydrolase/transferase [Candidatus Aminicenantes bacterium]|nr:MAG: sulfatase-like hydrolase/transferase [Candidatus Aminicenantes bacterium]
MNSTKKKIIYFAIPLIILLIVLAYFLFFPKSPLSRLKGAEDFNYIIISVDTLRADRIGCYGFSDVKTPTIDMFASRGVKFEKCIAQTPLTLPSHTSLLTGTYPTYHGVRDNGGFLVPQEMDTLAELMKQNGYQTSAFVAAYVLDSKWGLDQGFDFYFDNFDLSKYKTISLGNVQRPGNEVLDEVIPWLEEHKQQKFFTFIHFYDPHTPYEPPSPYSERYPNRPYVGEIAYTDSQISRLWEFLEKNGLLDNTILVFTSDHGESLGEHQEKAHGFFIYQAGVHVPLIFVTPFEHLQGLSRSSVVSLVDIMPTLLELAQVPVPVQVQGKSLVPLFSSESKNEYFSYCETYYPRFHYGWSELKSYQDERYKLIVAPKLELYDLSDDPGELNNIVNSQPEETRRLMNLINEFIDKTGKDAYELDYSHMDEESREKLAALGYIGTFAASMSLEGRRLGDPKEKIVIFNRLSEARELGLEGEFDRASEMIMKIIEDDPEVIDAYSALGILYKRERLFEEAIDTFLKVLELKPDDNNAVINISSSYVQMGKLDEGEEFILERLEFHKKDSQVYFSLGYIKNLKKEYEEAIKYFDKCIELNPSSASAYSALGGIYIVQDELDKAETLLNKAEGLNSKLQNLHYNFALLLEARGDLTGAMSEYLQELENIPHNFRASYNLSRLYRISKDTLKELEYLDKTIESNPEFPLSYFYKARIYLNQGEKFDEAISMVQKGIALEPEEDQLPLGYYLLADLYNRIGDYAKSEENLRLGEEARNNIKK